MLWSECNVWSTIKMKLVRMSWIKQHFSSVMFVFILHFFKTFFSFTQRHVFPQRGYFELFFRGILRSPTCLIYLQNLVVRNHRKSSIEIRETEKKSNIVVLTERASHVIITRNSSYIAHMRWRPQSYQHYLNLFVNYTFFLFHSIETECNYDWFCHGFLYILCTVNMSLTHTNNLSFPKSQNRSHYYYYLNFIWQS